MSCLVVIAGGFISRSQADDPEAAANGPDMLRQIALENWAENRREQSLSFYQKAIDKVKKDYGPSSIFLSDLCYEMGCAAFTFGKFSTAQRLLTEAVACNPNAIMPRLKLAEVYKREGHPLLCLQEVQSARKKNPRSVAAQEALVLSLESLGRPAEAAREALYLNQLTQDDSGSVEPTSLSENTGLTGNAGNTGVPVEAAMPAGSAQPIFLKILPNRNGNGSQPEAASGKETTSAAKTNEAGNGTASIRLAPGNKRKPISAVTNAQLQSTNAAKAKAAAAKSKRKHKEKAKTRQQTDDIESQPKLRTSAKRFEKMSAKALRGLVPPPPPLMPAFGVLPPMPSANVIAPHSVPAANSAASHPVPGANTPVSHSVQQPVKVKEKPKAQDAQDVPAKVPASAASDEPDFLIDWGGVNKKKKAK